MKTSSIILALALTLGMFSSGGCSKSKGDELKWYTNLEEAEKAALSENKIVFVDFTGSDWCVWCKKLNDEVFSQDKFIKYAKENLVLVKIDFPQSIPQSQQTVFYNRQLAQRFGVQGFPTIFLVRPNGMVIAQTGYQYGGAAAYVKHLQSYLM